MRTLGSIFAGCALLATTASAVEYKCKGKDGTWDAKYCTGAARPVESDYAKSERERASRGSKDGVPPLGISKDEARQYAFCMFPKINTTHTARGTHEQWVCELGYLYFDNGVLTSVQELQR